MNCRCDWDGIYRVRELDTPNQIVQLKLSGHFINAIKKLLVLLSLHTFKNYNFNVTIHCTVHEMLSISPFIVTILSISYETW